MELKKLIYTVEDGSPAQEAGLKQYDFIYAINGERVTTFRAGAYGEGDYGVTVVEM